MGKEIVTTYSFNASAKTINFSGISGFDKRYLLYVINVIANKVLYSPDVTGYGGTWDGTGKILTLQQDCTGMSNTDALSVNWFNPVSGTMVNFALESGGVLTDIDSQLNNLNVVLGSKTDAVASSDTGAFSHMSFWKRALQYLGSLVATPFATSTLQTSGNTILGQIKAKTDNLTADPSTATLQTSGNTILGQIKAKTDNLTADPSTATLQTSGNTKLDTVNTNLGVDGTGITPPTGATGVRGWLSGIFNKLNTSIAITVASLPLPTNAATSAKQDTGNTSLSSIDGKLNSQGQKAASGSTPVVLASDTVNMVLLTTNPVTAAAQNFLNPSDVSNYLSLSIQLASGWTGSASVYFSNDGTNWDNACSVMQQRSRSMTGTMNTANSIYNVKVQGKFCKISIVSFSSTTTMIVYASPLINTSGEEIAGAIDSIGSTVTVGPKPVNGNGGTGYYLSSAATTNTTLMRSGFGMLLACNAYNNSGSVRYLKFFNKNAPPTLGTDNPVHIFPLLPNANNYFDISGFGENYSSGIAFAITAGAAWNDATPIGAGEVLMNVVYN